MQHIIVRGTISAIEFKLGDAHATIDFFSCGMYRDKMHPDLAAALASSRVTESVYRLRTIISHEDVIRSLQAIGGKNQPPGDWRIRLSSMFEGHLYVTLE